MSPAPPPSSDASRQRVDVRGLSLAQLHQLAAQGSQRARAELEGRLRATDSGTPAPAAADDAPRQHLVDRLELIARQDEQRARIGDSPRLAGMVLIAWGLLILLGALVMPARGGGFYYLFCALGVTAVGILLMRCSRWAMALHGALLLAALLWAWRSAHGNLMTVLMQAGPLLIPSLWMAVPQVREPLE